MKKVSILILFLSFTFNSFAQNETSNSDEKLQLGFNLGLNYSNLVFDESNFPTNIDVYESIGFQLGILADYQFLKYFSVSPRMNLVFNESGFSYSQNGAFVGYEILPVTLETATYLIFRKPTGKMKPYIFIGPNYKIALEKQPIASDEFTTYNDLAIDFGIGLENRFKRFNFAPELKYSYGLNNLNQNPALRQFYLYQISLVFNFLG